MFLDLLDEVALVTGILTKGVSLYLLIMCLFFKWPKKAQEEPTEKMSFACVIPARNEELVVGRLVKSLLEQDYPSDLIKVFVIPNNCTDKTEEAARKAGAEIISVRGHVSNKGEVLHQAMGQLMLRDDIDAFLIFDADNIVDRGYMKAMNRAFFNGAQVTKSRIEAKNPYESWVSGCYALYYDIFNLFFNESRSRIGIAPKLIGTGLGIRRDLLLSMGGWNTVTIAEDTEFNAECVHEHAIIRWVPDAVTYDEAPERFGQSLKQRRRWVGGIMAVAREKLAGLVTDIKDLSHGRQTLDMLVILILPYFQVISLIPTGFLLGSVIYTYGFPLCLLTIACYIGASLAGLMLFGLILSILSPHSTRSMKKSIIMFPVFTISWLPLCIMAMFRGSGTWAEIKHTGSISRGTLKFTGTEA